MMINKNVDISALLRELKAAGVGIDSLRFSPNVGGVGGNLRTSDAQQVVRDFTEAEWAVVTPIVAAHVMPLQPIEYAIAQEVNSVLITTDALEHDVFVLPAELKSVYRAELTMSAVDAANGAVKTVTAILVWKRLIGNVVVPPNNITVLSHITDTAAATWEMNGVPSGTNFRVYVKGEAGRTINWFLSGPVGRFTPEGL